MVEVRSERYVLADNEKGWGVYDNVEACFVAQGMSRDDADDLVDSMNDEAAKVASSG